MTTMPEHAPDYPRDRTCPYQPPAEYLRLRTEKEPLHRVTLYDGRQAWLVTRHETARRLLADPRMSSDRTRPNFPALSPRATVVRERSRELHESQRSFIVTDPPEHDTKRRMLLSEFTVRRTKGMREDIERIVHDRIDAMLAAGPPADLVSRLSLPVPSLVICRLLGVPYADHDFFEDASRRQVQSTDPEVANAAREELTRYLDGLITELEREPAPGLLGKLVAGPLANGRIDRAGLVNTARLLLVAGHETTASMTTLSVITLLEHPEQLAALRADPGLLPGAVEELLRYLTNVDIATSRVATADIDVDGQLIQAGEGAIIGTSIANRDAAAFEDPDAFDVHRSARHHLAFGYGLHQCLGQNLARLELEVVLGALIKRVPTLRLAVPVDRLTLRPGTTIQGVNELPVTW
ncbi:cytochrome P450 [Streptomyces sp. RPT161]|uniref:cytochrome P450 n=1 Tax=Streptomyces sp. RPT161 TaxID=3015993 RepID=UPI0022B91E33|nr:cytochrome P450 [Streptomyces sp. RPT161]